MHKIADLDGDTALADIAYLLFFLNDTYRDTVPAQGERGREPRRTCTNL